MPKSLSVKNIPNLCRKLAHRYMQAFYTDWVYKVFWHFLKMYPICVECLHIGICKHSTQIGYIRLTPIPFLHKLGTFSKMCPICVECLRINLNNINIGKAQQKLVLKFSLFYNISIIYIYCEQGNLERGIFKITFILSFSLYKYFEPIFKKKL